MKAIFAMIHNINQLGHISKTVIHITHTTVHNSLTLTRKFNIHLLLFSTNTSCVQAINTNIVNIFQMRPQAITQYSFLDIRPYWKVSKTRFITYGSSSLYSSLRAGSSVLSSVSWAFRMLYSVLSDASCWSSSAQTAFSVFRSLFRNSRLRCKL